MYGNPILNRFVFRNGLQALLSIRAPQLLAFIDRRLYLASMPWERYLRRVKRSPKEKPGRPGVCPSHDEWGQTKGQGHGQRLQPGVPEQGISCFSHNCRRSLILRRSRPERRSMPPLAKYTRLYTRRRSKPERRSTIQFCRCSSLLMGTSTGRGGFCWSLTMLSCGIKIPGILRPGHNFIRKRHSSKARR